MKGSLFSYIAVFIYVSKLRCVTQKCSTKGRVIMDKLLRISERNKFEVQDLLPSDDCTNKLALYFQNFADQTRIKILSALTIKDLCVNDLSKILKINQTTISHQLKTLKDQGMVDYRREGKVLIYRIKSSTVNDMMTYAVKEME